MRKCGRSDKECIPVLLSSVFLLSINWLSSKINSQKNIAPLKKAPKGHRRKMTSSPLILKKKLKRLWTKFQQAGTEEMIYSIQRCPRPPTKAVFFHTSLNAFNLIFRREFALSCFKWCAIVTGSGRITQRIHLEKNKAHYTESIMFNFENAPV